MLGLFAFFYGTLHFLTYVSLDQTFSIPSIVQDVYKRPFITVGFIGFVVMIPLAITSTKKWIARLGGRQWQLLHRMTYISAIAGVVHYLWLVKADTRRPLTYGVLLLMLLGFRLLKFVMSRSQPPTRAGIATSARHSTFFVLIWMLAGLSPLVARAPSNFADAMTETTAKERSQGDAFGISHLGCDFFDALIARL